MFSEASGQFQRGQTGHLHFQWKCDQETVKPMGDVHAATEPFADGALKLETMVAVVLVLLVVVVSAGSNLVVTVRVKVVGGSALFIFLWHRSWSMKY